MDHVHLGPAKNGSNREFAKIKWESFRNCRSSGFLAKSANTTLQKNWIELINLTRKKIVSSFWLEVQQCLSHATSLTSTNRAQCDGFTAFLCLLSPQLVLGTTDEASFCWFQCTQRTISLTVVRLPDNQVSNIWTLIELGCLLETDRQLKKVLWAHSFAFRVDHPIFTKISRSMKGVFWGTFLSRHLPISGILNRATISSRYGISCSSANQRPCALRTMLVGEGRVVRNALSLILLSGWIERLYLFTKARSSIFLKLGGDKQGADGSFRQ